MAKLKAPTAHIAKLRAYTAGDITYEEYSASWFEVLPEPWDDIRCTCLAPGAKVALTYDHDLDCELWEHPGWRSGVSDWDHNRKAHVYDVDANFETLKEDWDKQLKADAHLKSAPTKTETKTTTTPSWPPKRIYNDKTKKWEDVSEEEYEAYWASYGYGSKTYTYQKCRHYEQLVQLPGDEGLTILCSSEFRRKDNESVPDFGCYMYSGWDPSRWMSYYLPWQDFGLPKVPMVTVIGVVDELIEKIRAGLTVEIGCMGGHGRTGSLLALIAVRLGSTASEAIRFVHNDYCHHAIEGEKQEWYIHQFAARISGMDFDVPPPFLIGDKAVETCDPPKPKPVTTTTIGKPVSSNSPKSTHQVQAPPAKPVAPPAAPPVPVKPGLTDKYNPELETIREYVERRRKEYMAKARNKVEPGAGDYRPDEESLTDYFDRKKFEEDVIDEIEHATVGPERMPTVVFDGDEFIEFDPDDVVDAEIVDDVDDVIDTIVEEKMRTGSPLTATAGMVAGAMLAAIVSTRRS